MCKLKILLQLPMTSGYNNTVEKATNSSANKNIANKLLEKIDYWRKKLLDLTLRNKLISFKDYKTSTLLLQNKRSLENLLEVLNNKEIYLYKYDNQEDLENDALETAMDQAIESDKKLEEIVGNLEPNVLVPNHTDKESEKRLYNLYLRSLESLREQGINTLFLAFGFLDYTDSKHSDQEIKAPFLLIPIEISKLNKFQKNRHNYFIRSLEEGYAINPALKQKLVSEYNIELPELVVTTDENIEQEITVWLDRLSKMFQQKRGWKVTKDICIGIFTFEKLQMYLDIEKNKDKVLENPLLQVLVGAPPNKVGSLEKIPTEEMLDEVLSPSDVKQVLDADSSQQVAIEAAKNEISFVIQGPPGTGKSQTIVNIIAELLSQDKKVLFVSEKMAALEVVKKRLDSVGLGEYCLELHSNKANKKHILKQLETQLNIRRETSTATNPKNVYTNLKNTRNRLNNYGTELLKPRGEIKYSLYLAIGRYAELEEVPHVKHKISNVDQVTPEEYNVVINSLKKLESYPYEVKNYNNHVWKGVNITEYSITNIRDLYSDIDELNTKVENISLLLKILSNDYGIKINTLSNIDAFLNFLPVLVSKPNTLKLDPSWFKENIQEEVTTVKDISNLLNELVRIENDLEDDYKPEFMDLDYNKYLNKINSDFRSKLRILKPSFWRTSSTLKNFTKERKTFDEIIIDVEKLKTLYEKKNQLKILTKKADNFKALPKMETENDWHLLSEQLNWIEKLQESSEFMTTKIIDTIVTSYESLLSFSEKASGLYTPFKEGLTNFVEKYFDIEKSIFKNPITETDTEVVLSWLKNLRIEKEAIREWIDFNNTFNELGGDLKSFFVKYIDCESSSIQLTESYIKAFLEGFIDHFLSESNLASFTGKDFLTDVNSFKKLDKQLADISRSLIIQQLEEKKPGLNSFLHTSSSEISTLRREIQKERRHMPVRKLLTNVSSLIMTLKPCFMMSPLSVAHYIDMDTMDLFDCVIFDEASQIMPEDAVCSIIRAKSAIIVGDTQQLPPTRFFSSLDVDYDVDEELEDLDSILGEVSTVLGEKYLKWHYRSRDEDLIAFSNRKFYDSRLVTFPNNKYANKETGIEFIFVQDGVYDRGGSRKNIKEAEKIVELIKKHIEETPTKSLGVVAFSMQQQMAIMEQVEVFIKQNPKYSNFFEQKDVLDEFFIKNLENVQGDERDIMIFSIGYGPDQAGKMTLNFGPINKTGGYKRLNVAITRAKDKVILVSSFLPESIPMEGISNIGVQYMLDYIRYAKNGPKELLQDLQIENIVNLESAFERVCIRKINSKGVGYFDSSRCFRLQNRSCS